MKRNSLVLEMTYYQNASKAGGTALAAFPESRLRYGVHRNVELYVDAPSEIAKSGINGAGIYVMTHMGVGAKYEFAHVHSAVYTVSFETRPPMSAFANNDVVPLSDVRMDATWAPTARSSVDLELSALNFEARGGRRSSAGAAVSYTREASRNTLLSIELATQSVAVCGAGARTSATFGITRALSARSLFSLELGTTLNATGNSKPHYLSFGFAFR